ncbi:hypothetical protein GLOTRDRAFT_63094 [Gloeophyllum trabeum ATCC 11539]|uniref:Uncharacterized protein n=1 Tax=Gloeophyllum trabeum (strain ATCC 11539 / FP-39264 / Madison 617) TaxID=670483 RepID=S7Q0R3_GLOTA|nr:uncharacterized protein GLOTRDRAFT_63094 [Gloeophyllum trabeum ATCC 11539]EPQ53506.1 hypothetical protein GLOTRDRAFT_63094 [Gloeophyllum trabeum ATCC 11539]
MRNHDNVKPRRKDGDDWLAGLDDDIYAIDIEMIEERMLEEAQAESRRIAEEAVRLAEAADIARRAEEARRQEEEATRKAAEAARKAEEVRRMEEEARRKAEEAMKKEEAARLKEEEIRRREAEVRRREEELKQRLENERQAKMSKIMTKDDVIQLFATHERQWNLITTAEELGWYSFPWPVFKKPSEPEDITTVAISAYVLSPHHQSDKSTKDRIKEHIRRWHPDRFETKYLPKVREDEQDKVKEGAGVVVRGLNELLTRSNINSAFS